MRPGTVVSTEKVAALILEKINEKQQPGKPMIIFIAGPSASGKSVLTGALQEKALQFESVKTDHFLKSFSELSAIPANQGLPVAEWPVVHGHADSFNRQLTEQLLEALSTGREFSYPLPSTYREGVMIGGFPRGERDTSGPHKQVQVPVSETYLIEGISTPIWSRMPPMFWCAWIASLTRPSNAGPVVDMTHRSRRRSGSPRINASMRPSNRR